MFSCTSDDLINDPEPITQERAIAEYQRHYQSRNDLIKDLGDHHTYMSDRILLALGY